MDGQKELPASGVQREACKVLENRVFPLPRVENKESELDRQKESVRKGPEVRPTKDNGPNPTPWLYTVKARSCPLCFRMGIT